MKHNFVTRGLRTKTKLCALQCTGGSRNQRGCRVRPRLGFAASCFCTVSCHIEQSDGLRAGGVSHVVDQGVVRHGSPQDESRDHGRDATYYKHACLHQGRLVVETGKPLPLSSVASKSSRTSYNEASHVGSRITSCSESDCKTKSGRKYIARRLDHGHFLPSCDPPPPLLVVHVGAFQAAPPHNRSPVTECRWKVVDVPSAYFIFP